MKSNRWRHYETLNFYLLQPERILPFYFFHSFWWSNEVTEITNYKYEKILFLEHVKFHNEGNVKVLAIFQESLFFVAVLRLKKRGGGMEGRLQPEKNDK